MKDGALPDMQVKIALIHGRRIQERKGEYTIKWNKWTLAVSIGPCFLVLKTAYRD
jgi:hypothetical protein